MSTWLITGCSTGLGRHLAQAVLEHGHNAVVTARDAAKVQALVDAHSDTGLALSLDVTDPAQVAAVAQQAEERFGGVDVLVNNAGYGYRAAVEEGEEVEVARLFATNFFGPVAMIKALLPGMRARRHGAIVNISSIGARISPPGSGYYSASKAALEGMSASLRKEVGPLGISVTVVEPGGVRTDFAGRSLQQSARPIADYAETAGRRRKENDTAHGNQPGDPSRAAQAIISAVEAPDPPFLLLLGTDALQGFNAVLEAQRKELESWESLTLSTGFPTRGEPSDEPLEDKGAAGKRRDAAARRSPRLPAPHRSPGRPAGRSGVTSSRASCGPGSPGPNPDGTTIALWWRSANAQAAYERMQAAGVPIAREPFDGPFGRTFTLTDPDGYKVTVYERDQPLFWPPRP